MDSLDFDGFHVCMHAPHCFGKKKNRHDTNHGNNKQNKRIKREEKSVYFDLLRGRVHATNLSELKDFCRFFFFKSPPP